MIPVTMFAWKVQWRARWENSSIYNIHDVIYGKSFSDGTLPITENSIFFSTFRIRTGYAEEKRMVYNGEVLLTLVPATVTITSLKNLLPSVCLTPINLSSTRWVSITCLHCGQSKQFKDYALVYLLTCSSKYAFAINSSILRKYCTTITLQLKDGSP